MRTNIERAITSRDYWVKVVEMLQQNWALIEPLSDGETIIYFVNDLSGVFDSISTAGPAELAARALKRNGFGRVADDREAQEFLRPPDAPFHEARQPNGLLYSSGRFWR